MNFAEARRILIYGGSFDPPHVAHVALPLLARDLIGADALAYIPAALPPHKRGVALTPAHHRLAMLRLAVGDVPGCSVLTDEIDREANGGGPSFTVDTLEAIRQRVRPDARLRLLIGTDLLRGFHAWREPERVVALAEPLVMLRPPETRATLPAALPPGYRTEDWEPRLAELPRMDVSATAIRDRVARGLTIRGLVFPEVEAYIRREGLYRAGLPPSPPGRGRG